MARTKRPKAIYSRGPFALHHREGRNLEIVWYDAHRKRERSSSAGTRDPEQGRLAVDRMFLESRGARHCPTCARPWEADESPLLLSVIADYLLLKEASAGAKATRTRLGHVVRYVNATNAAAVVSSVDEQFANAFRKWMSQQPASGGQKGGLERSYAIATIEGCLLQLSAAINATPGQTCKFKFAQPATVSESPSYRADVATIARMFDYCLRPSAKDTEHPKRLGEVNAKLVARRIAERANLLRFLRMSVATWSRPDAVYDVGDEQWHSNARVLNLNPRGRRQTKKFRPKVPIAKQFAPHLDELDGAWLPVSSIRAAWDRMAQTLDLPAHGEAGEKLIRRSMSTIVRKRIGEERWRQGEMMLGHAKSSISDIYAIPDPANLGLALAATETIIDEIEALAPGAFCLPPNGGDLDSLLPRDASMFHDDIDFGPPVGEEES